MAHSGSTANSTASRVCRARAKAVGVPREVREHDDGTVRQLPCNNRRAKPIVHALLPGDAPLQQTLRRPAPAATPLALAARQAVPTIEA